MSQLLSKSESNNLKLTQPIPVTLHPAAVYLDSLGKGSKLTTGLWTKRRRLA